MSLHAFQPQDSPSPDENEVRELYRQMLDGWNKRNAEAFAVPFAEDGESIGFDGSQLLGRTEIVSTLRQIFADHLTAPYVSKVKSVTLLSPEVAILRAIAGMVPPGQSELNPAVNTLQTLIAVKSDGQWRIVLFQNTPAQFPGLRDPVHKMLELRDLTQLKLFFSEVMTTEELVALARKQEALHRSRLAEYEQIAVHFHNRPGFDRRMAPLNYGFDA